MNQPRWPIIGRERELRSIIAALDPTTIGSGVILYGAEGVGKSRLAREAVAWQRRRGRTTTWVQANESLRLIPWGAFNSVVVDGRTPVSVLRATLASLARLGADGRPPVLVCDDAHLLDDFSAALVRELVECGKVRTLVTFRIGAQLPSLIHAMMSDDRILGIEVTELTSDAVAELLSKVLGADVEAGTVRKLSALTEGNPLYLRELVAGELDSGHLRQSDGMWRWSANGTVPPALSGVIASRLARLDEETILLVDLLTLCSPLPVRVLEAFVDARTFERAESDALIRASEQHDRGVVYQLAHPLFAEVARHRLGVYRSRRLHGELAVALRASRDASSVLASPGDVLTEALVLSRSDRPADREIMAHAASVALRATDLVLAERFGRLATRSSEGPLVTVGLALTWQGKGADAAAVFDRIASSGLGAPTGVLIARAGNLFWSMRDVDGGIRLIEEAIDRSDDLLRTAALTAALSAFTVCAGHCLEGTTMAESVHPETMPALARILLALAMVSGYSRQGRHRDLDRAAECGYAVSDDEAAVLEFAIVELHLRGLHAAGRISDAALLCDRFRAERTTVGEPGEAMMKRLTALNALICSRPASAVELLSEAMTDLEPLRENGWVFICQLDLAVAHAQLGDARRARSALGSALAERHPAFEFMRTDLLLAEAWVAASEGWRSEAIRCAARAADVSRLVGELGSEMVSLATLARLGHPGTAERLGVLAELLGSPRATAAARHALALEDHDAAALDAVSRSYEEMGDLIAALDAASQSSLRFQSIGDRARASRATHRAIMLSDQAEGALTPAFRSLERPRQLTPREFEVACLAADGRSNRDIAFRLGVSVRTVEGHVYNAVAKLGGSDRSILGPVSEWTATSPRSTRLLRVDAQAVTRPK